MHDLNFVRTNLELVEKKLRDRNADPAALLGDFRALDQKRREAITSAEQLNARINALSKQIGEYKRSGQDAGELFREAAAIKAEIEGFSSVAKALDNEMVGWLTTIPNLCRD